VKGIVIADATACRESLRLLVAEDDEEMRAWLLLALRPLAALVTEAQNGFELLDRLAEDAPYDLVITDIRMPHPSGLQVCTMARSAGVKTPFLVITAFPDQQVSRAIDAVGDADLLPKPFDKATLLGRVRSLLASVAR
jgi:two-component system cell cycle response regulator CpdR